MEIPEEIYHGVRDQSFKNMITNVLKQSNIKDEYISMLLNKKNIKEYENVFTHISADSKNNYEIYEQLGDMTANKFIVWYAYKRFPCLKCVEGVKIVARLRINHGARASFQKIGENLNFWNYISASVEERSRKKKDLLEDCFEAFIGCTEYILDQEYMPGVGYNIVHSILKNIFDKIPMNLSYNKLYDSKTRLKELFDTYQEQIGSWKFIEEQRTKEDTICVSRVYQIPVNSRNKQPIITKSTTERCKTIISPHNDWVEIGYGTSCKKSDAQQCAANAALLNLNRNGYVKEINSDYLIFETAPNQDCWF